MKKAEEILGIALNKLDKYENDYIKAIPTKLSTKIVQGRTIEDFLIEEIRSAQTEVYNQAIEDAAELAFPICDRYEDYWKEFGYERKQSILKLKS